MGLPGISIHPGLLKDIMYGDRIPRDFPCIPLTLDIKKNILRIYGTVCGSTGQVCRGITGDNFFRLAIVELKNGKFHLALPHKNFSYPIQNLC